VGIALTGALVWTLLSRGDGDARSGAGSPDAAASRPAASSPAGAAPTPRRTGQTGTAGLLTPEGIRSAIRAFERETGRDRYGSLVVYPGYASARLMVKGSATKYDSYTYWPGRGVEKGIISGTLSGGDRPVSLDGFAWDRVPALLAEAREKLNVEDVESRYLVVNVPDDTFGEPAGMAVYLSDRYNGSGYLQADENGEVVEVVPARG
jgi:hypothetical protein